MAQTHNPVEKAAGLTVYYPVVPAYKIKKEKEVQEALRTLENYEPMYEDRYGLLA